MHKSRGVKLKRSDVHPYYFPIDSALCDWIQILITPGDDQITRIDRADLPEMLNQRYAHMNFTSVDSRELQYSSITSIRLS